MKGFLTTLIIVCAVIGGLWFAYDPYIKPMLEKAPVMAGEDAVISGNSSVSPQETAPSVSGPATSSAPPASPNEKPAAPAKTVAAPAKPKTELDLLLEEKYPMPEIRPLEEIVDNWNNVPPRAYPPEVTAKETIAFQLIVDGQAIGSSNVAPGTPLTPIRFANGQLQVGNKSNPGMNTTLPVEQTDFKERIRARYDEFVANAKASVEKRREQVRKVVEADPAKLAMLKGEAPVAEQSDPGDPRFAGVKASLSNGEAASVKLEEATTFTWNGSEKIGGEFAGTFDTVTVHFEVATIFGRFPVEYKALLRGGKVVGWIDPVTEERI